MILSILFCLLFQPAGTVQTRTPQSQTPPGQEAARSQTNERPTPEKPEEPPVVTKHEMKIGARSLKYTVTTGMMPIKNREGVTEANVFFMAYTLDGGPGAAQRPLMFSFNGGPGSASLWLHLGAPADVQARAWELAKAPALGGWHVTKPDGLFPKPVPSGLG